MKEIIEKDFPHEVFASANYSDVTKIMREMDFDLIIASANMKFIDRFKILEFVGSDEKFSTIQLPPIGEKVDDSPIIHSDKKKIANVVTNLIG